MGSCGSCPSEFNEVYCGTNGCNGFPCISYHDCRQSSVEHPCISSLPNNHCECPAPSIVQLTTDNTTGVCAGRLGCGPPNYCLRIVTYDEACEPQPPIDGCF